MVPVKRHVGLVHLALLLRSHVFVAVSSCLADENSPAKTKKKIYLNLLGFLRAQTFVGIVRTLFFYGTTGNSSPTKTAHCARSQVDETDMALVVRHSAMAGDAVIGHAYYSSS